MQKYGRKAEQHKGHNEIIENSIISQIFHSMVWQIIRTDILSIAHIFPRPPLGSEKYYSTRKYHRAKSIKLELNDFVGFYCIDHALFYLWIWESQAIRYSNLVALPGPKESEECIHLIFVPLPTTKMIIFVYIIEQVNAIAWIDLFKLYLCGHTSQVTLSRLSVNRN